MSDELLESGGGVDTAIDDGGSGASEGGDAFGALQQRMEEGPNPWYSPSVGHILDENGESIINKATGKPFKTMDEYNAQATEQQTAKPQNQQQQQPPKQPDKPFSKSFEDYAFGEKGFSSDRMREIAKVGSDYKYQQELALRATQSYAPLSPKPLPVDPIQKVRDDRAGWEKIAINPLRELRDALIKGGGDPSTVDQYIGPHLKAASDEIEKLYREQFENATLEQANSKLSPKMQEFEAKRIQAESDHNINSLARAYFPEGGKEQFFALINGHNGKDGKWVPGPASNILDGLVKIATKGKEFRSDADIAKAYQDTFKELTADPATAKWLFDVSYNYFKGSNFERGQEMVFTQGKEAANRQQQRMQQTIKTKPGGYTQGQPQADPLEGLPEALRSAYRYQHGR
jgi:hypothetical protein